MDRDNKRARAADHAILVINIQVRDIDAEDVRSLQHDWQTINCNGSCEHIIPNQRHRRATVVGAIAGYIDDTTNAMITASLKQQFGKLKCACNRSTWTSTVRLACDLVGYRVGCFRTIDQPPRHNNLLIVGSCPLEISYRYLAVCALPQRLHKLPRSEARDVPLTLQCLFIRVH